MSNKYPIYNDELVQVSPDVREFLKRTDKPSMRTWLDILDGITSEGITNSIKIVASGAGEAYINGTYAVSEVVPTYNGKPQYDLIDAFSNIIARIRWETTEWQILTGTVLDLIQYQTSDNPNDPWDGTWITANGAAPVPTLTLMQKEYIQVNIGGTTYNLHHNNTGDTYSIQNIIGLEEALIAQGLPGEKGLQGDKGPPGDPGANGIDGAQYVTTTDSSLITIDPSFNGTSVQTTFVSSTTEIPTSQAIYQYYEGHNHSESDITDLDKYTQTEVDTKLSGKADSVHTHSEYAVTNHNHDGSYAPLGHNHDESYAPLGHTHDASYAVTNHNHDGSYAPLGHNHDESYAPLGHNHDESYAPLGHNHDGSYALSGHTHSEYAVTNHNHDGSYAPLGHNHDGSYALSGHTHSESDITDLDKYTQTEVDTKLSGKADSVHTHEISQVVNLQDALNGKSDIGHTHAMTQVVGLQDALSGKADSVHTHEISEVVGLDLVLENKANSVHSHSEYATELYVQNYVTNNTGGGGEGIPAGYLETPVILSVNGAPVSGNILFKQDP